eukprot:2360149-Lingulodinium_polyedra.AAC.1
MPNEAGASVPTRLLARDARPKRPCARKVSWRARARRRMQPPAFCGSLGSRGRSRRRSLPR